MPKIVTPLNNTQIKQAKVRLKEYNLMDGGGLALRIKPNGSKIWLFNYYHPYTKKRSNLGLGSYPDVSLMLAREIKEEYRTLLAQKIDPKAYRDENEQLQKLAHSNTLKHIASLWYETKKDQVSKNTLRSLEIHVYSRLGETPIHKINAKDTIEVINSVAKKGSLETVKRVCQRLNKIMIYAVNTGLIDANPLAGISNAFSPVKNNHYPTIKPEHLPKLMKTINRASIKVTTRNLIEFQLHTMVRSGEAAGAQWSEVDFENKLWVIPGERMKKNRPHSVPLTEQSLSFLEEMKPISFHKKYIFLADRNPNMSANPSTVNMALKRMGYGGILVAHGFRSIASTALNEQGFDPDVIESALAHEQGDKVRAAYNRSNYIERRKPLMVWWSDFIQRATFKSQLPK
ncbi:MAG: integrase [Kangiella sp.]|nr:MAG: integrase [Gammaproteobacteria bacterium]PHS16399.1 MAG: integrase [Kangiella sp.]